MTFAITAFEVAVLFFQVVYFLERPNDEKRLLYLIMLVLFILYNVTSGLFHDPTIPIDVMIQNVIAYLIAFITSMYFVYYYYKAFDLKLLRFFATFGSLIFLFLPFACLFVIPYFITGDLAFSRKLTVVIPFLYGVAFIIATTRAFIFKFRVDGYSDRIKFQLVLAAYLALLCWVTLPVVVFFGDFQVLEHSLTNVPRPDTRAPNSFPSGHTAEALAAATFMAMEFGPQSTWYSIGAYSMATTVGVLRVMNNRHWISDVFVGAGIGMLSTELAYRTHHYNWGHGKRKKHAAVFLPDMVGRGFYLSYSLD